MRLLWRSAAIVLVVCLLAFAALEVAVSGPLGTSGFILYRTLRTFVRDATIPEPPRLEDFSNAGPNVVILVLDCYRKDYLASAPNLRAFAERSWSFDRYYAAASWTKPSTVSLFTGLHVRKHYVVKGGGSKLPQEAVTLAELMQAQGFRTGGFVWNPHLTRRQDFDQGFDHYVDRARRGPKSLLYEFLSWVERERPERFFAYVHFQGTHDPYYVDNDLSALLTAPSYEGDLDFGGMEYKHEVNAGRGLSPDEAAHLRHVAEGKARRVDREAVGRFLERFHASGLPENTLLVITSDHGDAFGEHEAVSHGATIYEEEVHVPLIIHFPERFARERSFPTAGSDPCPASTVDLLPTVLDFTGHPVPSWVDGESLVPDRRGADACRRPVITERTVEVGEVAGAALISEHQKLIVDYAAGEQRLFDLSADPGESRDLSGRRDSARVVLERELARRLNRDGSSMASWAQVDGELSEAQREELRALGYIEDPGE